MNIIYLHDAPLDSQMANLVQVLFMCDAFSYRGNSVTLITRKHLTKITDPAEYIFNKIGITPKFKICSYECRFSKLSKFKGIGTLLSNVKNIFSKEFNNSKPQIVILRSPVFMPLLKDYFRKNKSNCKLVYELHNYKFHYESAVLNIIWKKLFLHLVKKEIITNIIVISNALKSYWINAGLPEKKILVYHDGFSETQFENDLSRFEARKLLRMNNTGKKIVTYTGSLYPDRGIELIISLATDIPDSIFYIVGGPQEYIKLYSEIIKSKNIQNIIMTGRLPQKEIKDYLFASDILLLIFTDKVPTINYCSPLKVFEYMASGRVIVGHAYPTIKEVLTDCKNCILSEPNNYNMFLEKMKTALSNDFSVLGINARTEAFGKYSWYKRVDGIINNIYN